MKKLILTTLLTSLYSTSAHAHGESHYRPKINGFGAHGDINLINAANYDSDARSSEFNDISTHSHTDIYYNFNDATSLNAAVQLTHEHAHSHGNNDPADNTTFQHHGIRLKEFFLEHKFGKANIYAGKIAPMVAFDYHDYPLVWAHEAAEEYAVEEKLGFGFGYKITDNQTINISTFFADTMLSDSALYSVSNNIDEDDRGAGNTEAFNNFAINYRINLPQLGNTLLNFGYALQKQGAIAESDENILTTGLKKNFSFTKQVNMDVIAEYASDINADGRAGRRIFYYNLGTRLNYDKAFLATNITDKDSNEAHPRTKYYNFAVGYEVMKDVEASVGWKAEDAKAERTESVMLMLSYKFDICPCD